MPEPGYWYSLAHPTIGEAEIAAATDVLRSGRTTAGEKVAEFEEAFAGYVGADYAVMVNSGSSADLLIALIPEETGEVLIPAVTWPTHLWAWKLAGFKPRFVDVDFGSLNTDTEIIEEARRPQTLCASVPHIMGIPAEVSGLDLELTEDCCEALGSNVGKTGWASAWSFFFSHHMTTMEGGMVTTPSASVAAQLRSMRSHGWARGGSYCDGLDPRYTFIHPGLNVRPTEVAAAIGLVQLERLDEMNATRRHNHQTLAEAVADVEQVTLPPAPKDVSWFGFAMFVDSPTSLAKWLEDRGVETRPILGGNLARQPAFRWMPQADLPGADYVHDHGLYIGLRSDETVSSYAVGELIQKWSKR